jgi:hypothetical protein
VQEKAATEVLEEADTEVPREGVVGGSAATVQQGGGKDATEKGGTIVKKDDAIKQQETKKPHGFSMEQASTAAEPQRSTPELEQGDTDPAAPEMQGDPGCSADLQQTRITEAASRQPGEGVAPFVAVRPAELLEWTVDPVSGQQEGGSRPAAPQAAPGTTSAGQGTSVPRILTALLNRGLVSQQNGKFYYVGGGTRARAPVPLGAGAALELPAAPASSGTREPPGQLPTRTAYDVEDGQADGLVDARPVQWQRVEEQPQGGAAAASKEPIKLKLKIIRWKPLDQTPLDRSTMSLKAPGRSAASQQGLTAAKRNLGFEAGAEACVEEDVEGTEPPKKQVRGGRKENAEVAKEVEEAKTEVPAEPRKMCVKVKNTDDMIEINLDKDRPESFESNEVKLEWEMASFRKALKFKKRVESGELIPPEIKKKLEEKERLEGPEPKQKTKGVALPDDNADPVNEAGPEPSPGRRESPRGQFPCLLCVRQCSSAASLQRHYEHHFKEEDRSAMPGPRKHHAGSSMPGPRSRSSMPGTRSRSTMPGTRNRSAMPRTRPEASSALESPRDFDGTFLLPGPRGRPVPRRGLELESLGGRVGPARAAKVSADFYCGMAGE